MTQILFYLGLIIMPLEWKIPTFPSLYSLWYKCCSLTINLVSSFPCECVKNWKLYLERETGLTWGLSYLLLVVCFLPDCRDKIKTPFRKLSFFLMESSKASVPLCSVFSSPHQIRSLKYLIFIHIFCLNERMTQWQYLASQYSWKKKSNNPSGSALNILPVLFSMNIDLSFIDRLVIVEKLFKTAAEKITGF